MNEYSVLLTFEWDSKNEMIEIHGNREGLERLRDKIDSLLRKKGKDHLHLMSTSWGGDELSDEKQGKDNLLINHVKILKWEEEKISRGADLPYGGNE